MLSCALESERTRWVEAVTPRTSDNPDEQIYEEWDCPQVREGVSAAVLGERAAGGMEYSVSGLIFQISGALRISETGCIVWASLTNMKHK